MSEFHIPTSIGRFIHGEWALQYLLFWKISLWLENMVFAGLVYEPHIYKRYADDSILCIPNYKLNHSFNSFHPRLQLAVGQQSLNIKFNNLNV